MELLANFVGCLHSEMECSHIINLAMYGQLTRLKHRLTEKEKRMIQPGYAFIYSEEESGIIRWTDSRTWTPSRALGPFMMYIEKRNDQPLIKKIYTARYRDSTVHIVIYNVYIHEEQGFCCDYYQDIRSKIIPESFSEMARTHLAQKKKRTSNVKKVNQKKNEPSLFDMSRVNTTPELINNSRLKNDNYPRKSLLYNNKHLYTKEDYLMTNTDLMNNEYSITKPNSKVNRFLTTSTNPLINKFHNQIGENKYFTQYEDLYYQYFTHDQYMSQCDANSNCDNTSYIDLNYVQDEIICDPIEISKEKNNNSKIE